MKNSFKLLPKQWSLYAKALSNISQAIILFSLAAIFVPETVSLLKDFSKLISFAYLIIGVIIFILSGIIMRKGK